MSFIEDEGQEPQDEREQDYNGIFQFFFQLAKPLLLELPSPEDRTLAAVWIQRLEREPEAEEENRLRVDYLKLLLFVMQRGRLIGMFKNEPPPGPLEPFPEGFGLTEMGNFLLEQAELQGSGDADGRKVSYNVEISNDLREFVAAQEIPDFGIQVYYAWSVEDPIYKWMSFDEMKCPQHVRDKIRQIKIVKSEERTNVKSGTLRGEKTDTSLRKSCDSTAYEKNRAKVKTPEEIEKSLERNRHSFTNSPSQRGSVREKAADDGSSWSPSRRSNNHSPDAWRETVSLERSPDPWRETGPSKFCGHGSNTEETDDEDARGGVRRGESSPCCCESAGRQKPEGCPHSNCKRDADTSKRLQKCDDAVENGSPQMNEHPYMAGPSQRMTDKCHGKDMYSESARCGGEAAPPQKSPCSPARGYQMNQALSQPSMKPRKSKCSAQAYQTQQEDANKKCSCSPATKAPPAPVKSQCSCPCPRTEKETAPREAPCFKKKEKNQLEKTCSKSKPTCPESMAGKRPQEQPCHFMEDAMKSCSRKMNVEAPEGCTCGDDRHKHQLENLSRAGREKMTNEPCPQELPPQQQQYACSRKKSDKRDKRPTEQPEEPVPGSCSKNRPLNEEDMKRRPEAFKDLYASQRPPQAVNASCCQQGTKLQDNRGPVRPCPGNYPPNGLGSCSKNQDLDSKMHRRPAREGEYIDKRCEAEVRELKYAPRQVQEYPANDHMPCAGRRTPAQYTYPGYQEPALRPNHKPYTNACLCSSGGQNLNRDEEACNIASSGSEENLADEGDGKDEVGVDPNNNPEECPIDANANEDGNPECSSSSENIPPHIYDFFDGTDYPGLPSKIRPGFGSAETPKKCPSPGYGYYSGAEQELQPQPIMAPFVTPISRQRYLEQSYTLPSRRRRPPDPQDFPSCNKAEPMQNLQYVYSSTPVKESGLPPFAHTPVSTIPYYPRSHCGQRESEDDLVPIHVGNQGGRTYSIHKENVPGRRKKTSQELECSRGQASQMQYMTLQDEENENPEMVRATRCSPGNANNANVGQQSRKWLDNQTKNQSCHYRRGI